jgi:hypothetical protein
VQYNRNDVKKSFVLTWRLKYFTGKILSSWQLREGIDIIRRKVEQFESDTAPAMQVKPEPVRALQHEKTENERVRQREERARS